MAKKGRVILGRLIVCLSLFGVGSALGCLLQGIGNVGEVCSA